MCNRSLLLAFSLICLPSSVSADSDGYFCTAPGFLAFDVFVPGEPGRIIKIVRFDPIGGIRPAEEVRISDDFQTHGISCRPGVVDVYSWDHLYTIDISAHGAPKVVEKRPSHHGRSGPPQENLGRWSREARLIVLESHSGDERFDLVIARAGFFIRGKGAETYTSTELVHRVAHEIREHRRVYFGLMRESAGH